MDRLLINGGVPLQGRIEISGAKNAVLPILAATLLAQEGESVIADVPFLDDVNTIQQVLAALGASLTYENETMRISAQQLTTFEAPYELVRKMRASFLAHDMQVGVHKLLAGQRELDHRLGFGVGLAMGLATVGRIGSEGRLDYTAIGNVVNLASRLCSTARDFEILCDRAAADAIGSRLPLVELKAQVLKGFDQPVPVHSLVVTEKA